MENIKGIPLGQLPIKELIKASDLIYFDGPLLSHFKSLNGEHFLYYWVDVDDNFNRWLVLRINYERLQDYINGRISLRNILLDPIDNFLYSVDIDNDLNLHNVNLVYSADLPAKYLPGLNSKYAFKPIGYELDLAQYSKKYHTGILQAYFNNSSKVPYNEINLHLFAPAIYGIHEITSGLSKVYLKQRVNNAPKDINNKPIIDRAAIKFSTEFNYFAQAAGSFSALFKPASTAVPMEGVPSNEDLFIEFVMKFISASEDFEILSQFVKSIDKKIITSYKSLLQTIIGSKLQFYLRWENAITNVSIKKDLNFEKANNILTILEKLEYDQNYPVKMTGKFIMAHTKTGNYEFEDIEDNDNVSKGKLDKDRLQMAWQINFSKVYDVVIERRESKQAGNKKPKINDTLISFIEIIDNKE